MLNLEVTIDKNNSRVKRSRYQKLLNSKLVEALFFISILGLVSSPFLLFFEYGYGWFVASASLTLLIFCIWYKNSIQEVPPIRNNDKPESILNSQLLANIEGSSFTAVSVAKASKKSTGYLFFNARFGLHPDALDIAANSSDGDWWTLAKRLWQDFPDREGIDAAHITVALIMASSMKQELLRAASTTEKDIIQGLGWLMYWKDMSYSVRNRQTKGGIARDWATGYTPMLNRFAHNISRDLQFGGSFHRDVFGHQQILSQMQSALVQAGRSNIILVGDTGVGKTTCVEAFAETLLFDQVNGSSLRFHQVYAIDTAAMLTQINNQNHLEKALLSIAVEAKKAKNILLYFPDIANLFGIEGGIDASTTLLPIIQNGSIRLIFSATEGQWKWLQQHKPQLATFMNYQAVGAPGAEDVMKILENKAIGQEYQYKCLFTYNALKDIYRLASRYGPEVSMPAKAINVMDTVARINANSIITPEAVSLAIEQTTGIKTGVAGESEKSSLLGLDAVLHQKVIGQEEAIATVVSALQRSRAGVSNQNKPIGTFLFLGPTGVGKTETAKAVASAYFGGEDRLIRVDMNEYVTQDAVARLLTSGATQSNSLLDSIRKQPFSVVLFDEIEKAHPDVVNSLLQMLDEGVMRNSENKEISFKDAIIIATSNAGAEHISTYEDAFSQNPEAAKKNFVTQLLSANLFKPELINRFDNIVMYRPLTVDQLEKVVDIQIMGINNVLSAQQLAVSLTAEARRWLAENGNDPLMGARPLRRLIQQTVENTVSKKILENSVQSGSGQTITLDVADLQAGA